MNEFIYIYMEYVRETKEKKKKKAKKSKQKEERYDVKYQKRVVTSVVL